MGVGRWVWVLRGGCGCDKRECDGKVWEMGTGCGGCDGRGCGSEVVGKSLRVGSGGGKR